MDKQETISRQLVRMALGMTKDDITPPARGAVKRLLTDTVGCMIAGWQEPGVGPLMKTLEQLGTDGPCTLPIVGGKARLDDAVVSASIMAHALDYDDVHCEACLHLMCKLIPTVLLTAQVCSSSGEEVVQAIAAGAEVGSRIGRYFASFPFLNSNIAGGFGVVAAVSRLMGLTEDQAVHAMGIYYARASGNRQALLEAAMIKRIQPAFAAQSAVWAAMMAKNGFTGAQQVFEGRAGLFETYCRGAACPAPEEIMQPRPFLEIEQSSVKSFPTCGSHHGAVMAAMALRREHAFELDEITRVDLWLNEALTIVGAPFVMGDHPQINAQFSAAYAVSVALLRDEVTLDMFSDEAILRNQDIAALASAVHTQGEYPGELPEQWPRHIMRVVRVTLKDGSVYEKALPNNPSSLYPERLSDEDVAEKFRGCARFSGICSPEKAESIMAAIRCIDECPDMADWIDSHLVLGEKE